MIVSSITQANVHAIRGESCMLHTRLFPRQQDLWQHRHPTSNGNSFKASSNLMKRLSYNFLSKAAEPGIVPGGGAGPHAGVMQVYVTVFADGPTRVLRFSDDPSTVNVDTEQSILDLAARLKQVLLGPLDFSENSRDWSLNMFKAG